MNARTAVPCRTGGKKKHIFLVLRRTNSSFPSSERARNIKDQPIARLVLALHDINEHWMMTTPTMIILSRCPGR